MDKPLGVKVVAALFILGGILGIIVGIGSFLFGGFLGIASAAQSNEVAGQAVGGAAAVAGALTSIFGILGIVFGIIGIFIGWSVWNLKPWSRLAATVIAIL